MRDCPHGHGKLPDCFGKTCRSPIPGARRLPMGSFVCVYHGRGPRSRRIGTEYHCRFCLALPSHPDDNAKIWHEWDTDIPVGELPRSRRPRT